MCNRSLFFLTLLLAGGMLYAATSDNNKPIVVTSNSLNGDLNKRVAVFSGAVVATQGTRQLQSDQAYLYFNAAGKIVSLKAVGSPATSTEVLDNKGHHVYGQALTIEYFPLKSFIEYEKEAMLQEDGNVFKGDLITYNIVSQVIASPETKSNTGVTTIILPPANAAATKS